MAAELEKVCPEPCRRTQTVLANLFDSILRLGHAQGGKAGGY